MEKLIARLSEGGQDDLLEGETIEAATGAQWSGMFTGGIAGFAVSVFFAADSFPAYAISVTVGVAVGVTVAWWRRRRRLMRAEVSTIAGQFPALALMAVTSRGDLIVWRQMGGGAVAELTERCRVTDIASVGTAGRSVFKRWVLTFTDGSEHTLTPPGSRDRTAFVEALVRHGYTE